MPSFKITFIHIRIILLALILNLISIQAEISREQKLLQIPLSQSYTFHGKSIAADFNANILKETQYKQSIVSPGLIFNHGFYLNKKKSSYFDSLNYSLNYSSFRKEYKTDELTDLSKKQITTQLNYINNFNFFKPDSRPFFLGIENQSNILAQYSSEKDFSASLNPDNLSDELKDALVSSWKKYNYFNINYLIHYSPKVGIGRIEDKSRVVKALIIEKLLLKRKVIKFPFSDLTIEKISSLIGLFSNNDLRKESNMDSFRNKLNTIVKSDAAADKDMLRFISPLDLKKVLLIQYPNLKKGIAFSIKSPGNISTKSKSIEVSYPYDIYKKHTPYEEKNIISDFRQDLLLNALFNNNLKDILFFNFSVSRVLLSTDFSPDFKDSHDNIKWKNVLDTRWNLNAHFVPHPNFQIELGAKNLRSYVFIPNNPPEKLYTLFNIFIEDNLLIKTQLQYNFQLNKDPYQYLYKDPQSQFSEYRKLVFTLILCYNF